MTEAADVTRITSSWGIEAGSWGVLVHGGAGDVPAERVPRHVDGARLAAQAAADVLRSGGTALDAVERAVLVLEDDPSFNAGTGACLNHDGLIELDAAIMEGTHLRAGGVCALPPFPNPVAVARAVLQHGRHVLLSGEGAARFAIEHGFTATTSEAMTTETARARWKAVRDKLGQGENEGWAGGTVGCVARDARGSVAAATSTGGRVNKHVGRVGDSPIPGAGNYADDDGGACSATGDGEAVLRLCLGKRAVDLMAARVHPEEAARAVIRTLGARTAGTGGVILVDRTGRLGLARNTRTMTWAAAGEKLPEILGGA
jgi:beta-aspartyl-peptidase (threonine type)